jgi:hypothetical protein
MSGALRKKSPASDMPDSEYSTRIYNNMRLPAPLAPLCTTCPVKAGAAFDTEFEDVSSGECLMKYAMQRSTSRGLCVAWGELHECVSVS